MTQENAVDETKRLLSRVAQELQAGNKDEARRLVCLAVDNNPDSETAWLWRMSLAKTKQELVEFGGHVLRINPDNPKAREWLRKVVGDEAYRRIVSSRPADAPHSSAQSPASPGGSPRTTTPSTAVGALPSVNTAVAPGRPETDSQRSASSLANPAQTGNSAPKKVDHGGRFSPGDVLPPKSAGPSTDSSSVNLERLRSRLEHENRTDATRARPQPAPAAAWTCPLCDGQAERKGSRCGLCGALLELDALSGVRSHLDVDRELLDAGILRLQRLLDEAPDAEVHLRLAVIHLNLNNAGQAGKHLHAAMDLRPDDREIQSQLRTLRDRKVVLVVDSDEEVRARIAAIVEPYRMRVTHASSGLQALSQVQQDMPDLILLSMKLPRMDGYEVCRILRKNAAAKNLPIVMLTEKSGFVEKLRGRVAGVAGSVEKPIEPTLLLRTLKKSLPDSYLPDPELSGGATLKM